MAEVGSTVPSWIEAIHAWRQDLARKPRGHPRRVGLGLMALGTLVFCFGLPVKLSFMHAGAFTLFAGALLAAPPIHRLPFFWVGLAWSLWQLLSVLLSPFDNPIRHWGMAYTWLVLPVLLVSLSDRGVWRWAWRLLLVGLALEVLITTLQFVVGFDAGVKPFRFHWAGERWTKVPGIYGGSGMTLAYMMAACMLLLIILRPPVRSWWRWASTVGAGVALLLAQRRGATLGLIAGLVTTFACRSRRHLLWSLGISLLVGLLLLAVMGLLTPDRLQRTLKFKDSRFVIWPASIEVIRAHPTFGTGGAEAFEVDYAERAFPATCDNPKRWRRVKAVDHAHNSLLAVAAEHGIPAGLLYLALLIMVVHLIYRSTEPGDPARRNALGVLAFTLMAGMWDNYAGDSEAAYASYCGFALILAGLVREPSQGSATKLESDPP